MQFLGQKWAIFGPKMSQKCPKLFSSLTALKVDEVSQVSSILDIKKVQKCPHLSQNQPKSQFLGQKCAIFGPKMSPQCLTLFSSSSAQNFGPVPQVSSIFVIIKYGFNPHTTLHVTTSHPLSYVKFKFGISFKALIQIFQIFFSCFSKC